MKNHDMRIWQSETENGDEGAILKKKNTTQNNENVDTGDNDNSPLHKAYPAPEKPSLASDPCSRGAGGEEGAWI